MLEGLFGGLSTRTSWITHRETSGLSAIIAVHSTLLGPSLGGARFYPYGDEKLSRSMTSSACRER